MKYNILMQKSLDYLKKNSIEPTPENYRDIFCSLAKINGIKLEDCSMFETQFKKLDLCTKMEAEKAGVKDINSLISFLIKNNNDLLKNKVDSSENSSDDDRSSEIAHYKRLLIKSFTPSFNASMLQKIKTIAKKLKERDAQIDNFYLNSSVDRLITDRIEGDRKIVFEKLYTFNSITDIIYTKLNKIVHQSDYHTKKLIEMRKKINALKESDDSLKAFELIKNKLMEMNTSLSNEITKTKEEINEHKRDLESIKKEIISSKTKAEEFNKKADELIQSEIEPCRSRALIDEEEIGCENIGEYEKSLFNSVEENFLKNGINYTIVYYEIVDTDEILKKYKQVVLDKIILLIKSFVEKVIDSEDVTKVVPKGIYIITTKNIESSKKLATTISDSIGHKKFKIKDNRISLKSHTGTASRADHNSLQETIQKAKTLLSPQA